jgi:hypothetical protein
MICFAKSVLTEELYIVHKEEFSITCYMCDTYLKMSSIFIRDKPILSSERMLHKYYDHKGSVGGKISGHEPQGAWRLDEVIGCKPTVTK